jgi:hypothetical protein
VRAATAQRILDGLGATSNRGARTAVHGWLWFMDGACLDWIAHRDLTRAEIQELLLGTLAGRWWRQASAFRRFECIF